MKLLPYVTLFLLITACKQQQEQPVIMEKQPEPEAVAQVETAIPALDFDALAAEYLHKQNDTTYVVNFWATWCRPCVKELPVFEQVHSESEEQTLKVVLVSLDFPERLNDLVVPFIERKNIKSEVVLLNDDNANRWIPLVSDQWSGAIPATLIVKNGQVVFHEGSHSYETLKSDIQSIF